ncbi:HAD-like protein [Ceratobasidium sp. AG-I]|nr:HAD-like protein [Ceratobasidium sp. AG-I]
MTLKAQVKYCLFDLDGLFIDSDAVEFRVRSELLSARPQPEGPIPPFSEAGQMIADHMKLRRDAQLLAWPQVQLLPGAHKLIAHLAAHKVPMAVATESQRRIYELKTGHLGATFELFGGAIVCADDDKALARKPAPDLFLAAANRAGIAEVGVYVEGGNVSEEVKKFRAEGLVFEDSSIGVTAGKRAGMNVVWVPDPKLPQLRNAEELEVDETLASLEDFNPESWGLPPYPTI